MRSVLRPACLALALGCSVAPPAEQPADRKVGVVRAEGGGLVAAPSGAAPTHEDPPEAQEPAAGEGCGVPSLAIRSPADARLAVDLADCRFAPSGDDRIGDRCGTPAYPGTVALDRLDEAVVLSEVGRRRVREIAQRGRELGRRRDVFALVGDSITASPKFLRPFARGLSPSLSDEVAARLTLGSGELVIEAFQPADVDPFSAPRAAKIGALAAWAVPESTAVGATPLGIAIARLSPSVAFVMFGSNDATVRFVELGDLRATFRRRLETIVEVLLDAGVVPVIHTVVRHMRDETRPDCDLGAGDLSNWRMAVQTSALSAVAAELACERALPLIDLRHAFDALRNHGIGPDGVHPNAHQRGAGALDPEALACGYNTRNYVTLRMLTELYPLLGP